MMADFRDTLWRLNTALEQLQNFDFEEVANEFHEMAVDRNTAQTALKQAERRIAELEQEVKKLKRQIEIMKTTKRKMWKARIIEWLENNKEEEEDH
jgi:hypothetical protein